MAAWCAAYLSSAGSTHDGGLRLLEGTINTDAASGTVCMQFDTPTLSFIGSHFRKIKNVLYSSHSQIYTEKRDKVLYQLLHSCPQVATGDCSKCNHNAIIIL